MKRKSVIFIILLSLPFFLKAQNARISILANPQISWLSADIEEVSYSGSILGINTGIELDLFFADNYAFSTGLKINSIGGSLSYSDSVSVSSEGEEIRAETVKYRTQYLSVPIGLKLKTVEIGYFTIWVNPGLSPMVRLKAQGYIDDESEKQNLSDEIGLLNINYFIEAGVEYSLGGSTALIAGLGYYSGFMDITDHSADKVTSGSVGLVLGILF
ncbi:MAG: PorT family protein [Bacteroidales bacterium]|nr:PorT family protein [Bacteroidales bacterium]MCF8389316.1 PorT family protein [Bacteroidales bacterium]